MKIGILGVWLGAMLSGCAGSADLRPLGEQQVLNLMKTAVDQGVLDPRRTSVVLRRERLQGWVVESFAVGAEPPFDVVAPRDLTRRQFLIDADPKKTQADRYWTLSTSWMVTYCQHWAQSIRTDYQDSIAASRVKIGPVRCNRLVSPDGSQVYDVALFSLETGSFIDATNAQSAAERLVDRYRSSMFVYGPGIRELKPELGLANVVGGFAVAQVAVGRYTYARTFLGAEFGKSRLYDSYVLLLVGSKTAVVVQTFYDPDVAMGTLWPNLSAILRALYQPGP